MLALLVAVRFKDLSRLKSSLATSTLAFFNHPALLLLGFIGIAVVIYFATYIPEMLAGDSFPTIINLQIAMFSFHSGSVVDSSSAPWWCWPFMFRLDGVNVPRWFDISYLPNNVVSTISVFGNPVVWWIGFALMLVLNREGNSWTTVSGKLLQSNIKIIFTMNASVYARKVGIYQRYS